MSYDFLVVGAGIFGATVARELTDAGQRVLVIDRRPHLAGQCYTESRDGQVISLYGGHIFHTSDRRLWDYANRFARFRPYSHHVKARAGETVYSFPPNRMTYQQLGANGHTAAVVREAFFVGYTEKMWGRTIDQVPAAVLARIPMRDDWNDEYFSDTYQGMPEAGYTPLVERLLDGVDVRLGVDYLDARWDLDSLGGRVIYTGPIDELFDCDQGRLEYRGLRFEHRREETPIYQGCPTMNWCDRAVPWLREEEWKYFFPPAAPLPYSWVTRTYPDAGERLYPVNDERNGRLAAAYQARARAAGYVIGGRLADYRYYDMHQAIAAALHLVKGLL